MTDNFSYKPKGIDIRVNKGKKNSEPDESPCEWADCTNMGSCKAPKSPDRLRDYYNFCTAHAQEYNRNWNFFSGMTDEDISEWQAGARHGHRPTWDMRKNTSEWCRGRQKRRAGHTAATAEGYNILDEGKDRIVPETPRRRLSEMQIKALNDMGLDDTATKADVRKRYTQLVKQLHPDVNQGNRNTEESFRRVVRAYKIIKTTELG
ncbi:MAG: J domain-containing protein [Hyphomonadaceae bacterium]|nr:J domain-containing protein [Hyphomonadaceae bacterium]